ncbi:putative reverse transcriptase domain-containing protein [Tanacetum coccineum]
MRQKRWIKLFGDYECEHRYHPRKANVVADALNVQDGERDSRNDVSMDQLIERKEDRSMNFIWVPLIDDVRTLIMDEDHASTYLVKAEHQRPSGLLQQPEMPKWKLTKSAHFLAMRDDYSTKIVAKLYIDEIFAQHGVLVPIISDRDGRFTLRLCERTIQTLEDMLRAWVIDFGGNWDVHLPCKPLEFEVRDRVLLKVSPWKGMIHFGKKVKLAQRIKVHKTLRFVKEPVEIIDREIKSLKPGRISIVKVCWNSKRGYEDFMKTKYPHVVNDVVTQLKVFDEFPRRRAMFMKLDVYFA